MLKNTKVSLHVNTPRADVERNNEIVGDTGLERVVMGLNITWDIRSFVFLSRIR